MKIIVDADACPKGVLAICKKQADLNQIELWTVANFNHQVKSTNHIIVGNASQEADIKIVNITVKGDIVITQDWGLAAMILGKGAAALSPGGKVFRQDNIDFLLEEREVKAKLRRSGGRTKGPRKRAAADDEQFERSLLRVIEEHRQLGVVT
ncbi:YaiI/YqxD family protein [Peptococcaceae bacterium 1198_IL3148]